MTSHTRLDRILIFILFFVFLFYFFKVKSCATCARIMERCDWPDSKKRAFGVVSWWLDHSHHHFANNSVLSMSYPLLYTRSNRLASKKRAKKKTPNGGLVVLVYWGTIPKEDWLDWSGNLTYRCPRMEYSLCMTGNLIVNMTQGIFFFFWLPSIINDYRYLCLCQISLTKRYGHTRSRMFGAAGLMRTAPNGIGWYFSCVCCMRVLCALYACICVYVRVRVTILLVFFLSFFSFFFFLSVFLSPVRCFICLLTYIWRYMKQIRGVVCKEGE